MLTVDIDPKAHTLSAVDVINIQGDDPKLELYLGPAFSWKEISQGERPLEWDKVAEGGKGKAARYHIRDWQPAGPMGRTVEDAAILFAAMVGADPADPLAGIFPESLPDYARNLSKDALKGTRIGVFRGHHGAGNDARVDQIVEDTIVTLKSLGAEIVDPVEIDTEGMSAAQREVLYYEFKADLNAYLENSGAAITSMAGIIEYNDIHSETVMPFFGQERLLAAQVRGPLSDPVYLEALANSKLIARTGIDKALEADNLDALIAPTRGPAWLTDHINGDQSSGISSSSLAAVSGYASITVPAGNISGLPIGISFIGAAFSDADLIQLAYAFEQAGYVRKPPLAGSGD